LSEFRRSVEALLSRLPTIFGDSAHTSGGATGPALYGALALLVSPLKTNINRPSKSLRGWHRRENSPTICVLVGTRGGRAGYDKKRPLA
jgi:hypothetical protein